MCTLCQLNKDGQVAVGKNYDIPVCKGRVCLNQRGIQKEALILPLENPVRRTSKHGSITFNQVGKEQLEYFVTYPERSCIRGRTVGEITL